MIRSAEDLAFAIDSTEFDATIIMNTLTKVSPAIAENWLKEVTVVNGHIAHTSYGELANSLSFREFMRFYEALGYSLKRFAEIQDKVCKQVANACYDKTDSTCDDSYCLNEL